MKILNTQKGLVPDTRLQTWRFCVSERRIGQFCSLAFYIKHFNNQPVLDNDDRITH